MYTRLDRIWKQNGVYFNAGRAGKREKTVEKAVFSFIKWFHLQLLSSLC